MTVWTQMVFPQRHVADVAGWLNDLQGQPDTDFLGEVLFHNLDGGHLLVVVGVVLLRTRPVGEKTE